MRYSLVPAILCVSLLLAVANATAVTLGGRTYEQEGSTWYLVDSHGEMWEIVPDRIEIKFGSGVSTAQRASFAAAHGFTESPVIVPDGYFRFHYGMSVDPISALEGAFGSSLVVDAELPYRIKPQGDPYFDFEKQWNAFQINLDRALEVTHGNAEILVAIHDFGVDKNHEDLSPTVWSNPNEPVNGEDDDDDEAWYGVPIPDDTFGWNFESQTQPTPINYHGTLVAGMAAAANDNNIGLGSPAGGAAASRPIRWLAVVGSESFATRDAIRYCIHKGVDIINLSFLLSPGDNRALTAILEFTQAGGLFVAASGNICYAGGPGDGVGFPASHDSVFAVGAVDSLLAHWDYSCDGPELDVVAPAGYRDVGVVGVAYHWSTDNYLQGYNQINPGACNCASRVPDNRYTLAGGTSSAAPQVAGVAALVWSERPSLTAPQVKALLRRSARDLGAPGKDDMYGYGVVDAYRAVTRWGTITQNTTWSGVIHVSGDIVVNSGVTLTIAAGTVVRIAPDNEQAGTDPYRVQIVVKGALNIAGTSANPVTFESFTDSAPTNNDWLGIQFDTGSSGTLSHVVIGNAKTAIKSYVPLTVDNVTIKDGSLVGIHAFAGLTISNSTLRDIVYPAIKLEGGNLTATNVEIHDCSSGIVGGEGTGTISITDCNIHDIDDRGIEFPYETASLTIDQTTVEDCLDGILIADHSSGLIDACTIRRNDIGIWTWLSTGLLIRNCEIDSNTTNGIYATLSQATIEADTVAHSAVGVFFNLYSGGTVHGGALIANNSGGIKCDVTSNPSIRHTRITANTTGAAALNNSAPDLGVAASGEDCDASGPNIGNNSIYNNSSYHVSNFSTGLTIAAEGNWWNADPPHASKFYGLVSREPYLCDNPNPVSPGDGTDPGTEGKPGSTLPTRYSLGASQPNPFNPVTTMTFDVPAPGGEVEISIFDVKGANVQTLVHGRQDAGTHTATWTGRSDSGEPVASGVYFVRMTASSFTQTRKVVLLK